jgi:hypothetical protein
VFAFNGRLFVKGARQRHRYLCRCLNDGRDYLVGALAPVGTGEPAVHHLAAPTDGPAVNTLH